MIIFKQIPLKKVKEKLPKDKNMFITLDADTQLSLNTGLELNWRNGAYFKYAYFK